MKRKSIRTDGHPLNLRVPAGLMQELRRRAANETTTVRALVLDALRVAGYEVCLDELRDRRRP